MRWILLILIFFFRTASADIAIGAAVSSQTSGRQVPSLNLALLGESFGISAYSTGIKTALYYQSGYVASAYYLWSPGELLSGPITAGIGAGMYYGKRGYRETETSALTEVQDSTGGPAFRVEWRFLGPFYLSGEALFGLRLPAFLVYLSAQDIAHVAFGLRF